MSRSSRYDLEKRAKQGFRGYPIATIAFYGIIGCPHEEGTDYPEGKSCPSAPSGQAGIVLRRNAPSNEFYVSYLARRR